MKIQMVKLKQDYANNDHCTNLHDYIKNPQNYKTLKLLEKPTNINNTYKYTTFEYTKTKVNPNYGEEHYDAYYAENYGDDYAYSCDNEQWITSIAYGKIGSNALHLACQNNQLNIVKYLVEECGVNINKKQYCYDKEGRGRGRGSFPPGQLHEILIVS